MRLQDNEGMNQRVQMEVDDPRRFSVHLAPIPQPPTQDNIVASQKSIFEDQDKTIDLSLEHQFRNLLTLIGQNFGINLKEVIDRFIWTIELCHI